MLINVYFVTITTQININKPHEPTPYTKVPLLDRKQTSNLV